MAKKARLVIIGGGIVDVPTAYDLSQLHDAPNARMKA